MKMHRWHHEGQVIQSTQCNPFECCRRVFKKFGSSDRLALWDEKFELDHLSDMSERLIGKLPSPLNFNQNLSENNPLFCNPFFKKLYPYFYWQNKSEVSSIAFILKTVSLGHCLLRVLWTTSVIVGGRMDWRWQCPNWLKLGDASHWRRQNWWQDLG